MLTTFVKAILVMYLMAIVVGMARKAQTTIHHYALHRQLFKSKKLNLVISQALSTILLTQPFDGYTYDHLKRHHPAGTYSTIEDADGELVNEIGFNPGKSKKELWSLFWLRLFSWSYHKMFLKARLHSNFVSAPVYRRIMAFVWWAFILVITVATDTAIFVLIAYILPITFLYQMSALVQFLSEHMWFAQRVNGETKKEFQMRTSWGRFMGEALPSMSGSRLQHFCAMALWWMKMIFIYMPLRIFLLPGDLSQHDYHHYKPAGDAWLDAAYNRERDMHERAYPYEVKEFWNLFDAIDYIFDNLSKMEGDCHELSRQYEEIRCNP